jgi:hypothetical protein
MNKAQNRNLGRKGRQGNMSLRKAHNHTTENLVDSEGDKSPFVEVGRMMIRMFNELEVELKVDIQKQLNESQENMDKKFEKT